MVSSRPCCVVEGVQASLDNLVKQCLRTKMFTEGLECGSGVACLPSTHSLGFNHWHCRDRKKKEQISKQMFRLNSSNPHW